MPEETEIEIPVTAEEKIPETPVVTEEEVSPVTEEKPKEKFRKVIQPVDFDGKSIGQPHVYEADTQEELIDKIAAGVVNGTKKIHQLTRRNVLDDPEGLPEGAELEEEAPVWKPRALTEEEKFVVQNDPEKAFDIQFKAKYGMSPEEKAKVDQENYENNKVVRMKAETDQFVEAHPEYVVVNENAQAMLKYMERNRLKWTKENLDRAYRKLSADGLLVEAVVESEIVPPAPRTEAAVVPPATPAPQPRTSFPSAIRNATGRATAPVAPRKGPSAEEFARMSSDDLKKLYPELRDAR